MVEESKRHNRLKDGDSNGDVTRRSRSSYESASRGPKKALESFFLKPKLGLVHGTSSKIHELGKTIKRWLKLNTITDYQSVT